MARKTHRPDDILWPVTESAFKAVRDTSSDIVTLGAVLDTKYPRKAMVKLFDEKLIHVNGHKATPHTEVSIDDEIWIAMAKEKIDHEPIAMDLHILYEDDDLLIVDKPAGVTVNSKDQVQMDDNTFEKWYMAIVEGIVESDSDSLVLPMDRSIDGIHYEVNSKGKDTRTDYTVLHRYPNGTVDNSVYNLQNTVDIPRENVDSILNTVDKQGGIVDNSVHNLGNQPCTAVAVRLYTGKTHQIRVAFSHIGHPLVGDTLYGAKFTGEPFALRAMKVVFTHMRSGERITVQA